MLDIKDIRANPHYVATRLAARGFVFDVAEFQRLDAGFRAICTEVQNKQARLNKLTSEIGAISKRGGDIADMKTQAKTLSESIATIQCMELQAKVALENMVLSLPNLPYQNEWDALMTHVEIEREQNRLTGGTTTPYADLLLEIMAKVNIEPGDEGNQA